MRSLSTKLKQVYGSEGMALIPGGGTFGMEAIARQFANDQNVLVVQKWLVQFSLESDFSKGNITSDVKVLSASPTFENFQAPFKPQSLDDITKYIHESKPSVVFAPHVETSAGIILPDEYLEGHIKCRSFLWWYICFRLRRFRRSVGRYENHWS